MNVFKNITATLIQRRFVLALLGGLPVLCLLVISGCATQQITYPTPPPLKDIEPIDEIADVDVLAVSPRMEEFLKRYILPYRDRNTRLDLLVATVSKTGTLGFNYGEDHTLTASEAFDQRTGNCISFANMLIALARRSGLHAQYQEITRLPDWAAQDDTILVLKHINVVMGTASHRYVVDVSGIEFKRTARRRLLQDDRAKAMYFSNIGAMSLLENDLATAYAYLDKAIDTSPAVTNSWINLGVVYSRNGQFDDAILAQQTALEIDAEEYSALSNLYVVYSAQEDFEAAELISNRVEKYRRKNPYYLLALSDEEFALANYGESIRILQRAIKKKDGEYRFYSALAKSQYMNGMTTEAHSSLQRARDMAPEEKQAFYNRGLHELVEEQLAQLEEMPCEPDAPACDLSLWFEH